MKCVVFYEPQQMKVESRPVPEIGSDECKHSAARQFAKNDRRPMLRTKSRKKTKQALINRRLTNANRRLIFAHDFAGTTAWRQYLLEMNW